MRYDFSLLQRAEDKWTEARKAADEQRHIKQAEAPGADAPHARRMTLPRPAVSPQVAGRLRRWLGSMAGFLSVLLILSAVEAAAGTAADLVRNLAENVLGRGTVTTVRIADEGQTVYIRWESATYRPSAALSETRGLIFAEAELATGSIMGRLYSVNRVRFSLLRGDRMLATGQNVRGTGVRIAFAPALGGGTMNPAPVVLDSSTKKSKGGLDAQPQ